MESSFFDKGKLAAAFAAGVAGAGLDSSERAKRAAAEVVDARRRLTAAAGTSMELVGHFAQAVADHVRARGATEVSAEDVKQVAAAMAENADPEIKSKFLYQPKPVEAKPRAVKRRQTVAPGG